MKVFGRFKQVVFALSLVFGCTQARSFEQAVITIDPQSVYQTITGWEAVAEIGTVLFPNQFQAWKETVADMAANDLGINRLRLEVRSGTENPVDYFARFITGQGTREDWQRHRYESINDNNDPFSISQNGFQFGEIDHRIDNIVLPLKQRLEAKGEKLYVNLNYVDFHDGSASGFRHRDSGNEYAELLLATFMHIQSKYGWVPDAVEVILEPDNAGWTSSQIGSAIVAAGNHLKSGGFNPTFIAPSAANMQTAIAYFDQLIQVPGVSQYLSEFAYHRYAGVSDSNLRAIGNRATQYGISGAMLEHIGSGYEDLHNDLKLARSSAWQQFALAFPTIDNGAQYLIIDVADPSRPRVNLANQAKFLRQYFKYIRRGARRVEAASNNTSLDPLCFINVNGNYVVVVRTDAGGSFSIQGLPAGTYGVTYTTSVQSDIDTGDTTIGGGQTLSANIPERGVITVYAKATQTEPPGDQAVVEQCTLNRTDAGTFTLTVAGRGIRQDAAITVGGVTPKKTKFKNEVSPGVFTKAVLKGRFCTGLPGDIVIVNPGPGAKPSQPFGCNQSCS